jgi:hypothetical protein
MEATTEKVIKAYINLRDAIAEMKARHKEELKTYEEQLDMLDKELLKRCEEAGGNISVANVGRVTRRLVQSYWTSDWAAFYKLIKEHDAFHLLHQRISNKQMQQFLEDNPEITPPGLNVDSEYAVTVTRAS